MKNNKSEPAWWQLSSPALKIVTIMKLTISLFLLSTLSVMAIQSYAQKTLLTLDQKNSSVERVLNAIEEQSEFYFLYSKKMIDVDKSINISVQNKTVMEILDEIFHNSGISYEIVGRQIVLAPPGENATALISSLSEGMQQSGVITGKVTDRNGEPMPGVTVVVKGTTRGTVTNADGNYTLTNIAEGATLVYSFVGMRTQELIVGSQTSINVTLEVDAIGIEEIIAIGYGIVKRTDLTSSVSTISVEDALMPTSASVSNLIQGRASGINVTQGSAQPGASVSIRIRGATSAPLYVVDGVPLANNPSLDPGLGGTGYGGGVSRDYLATINPADIESITILKDASSTAIYGSAAANGVVLITTKRGKEGDVAISYSGNYSIQSQKPYFPVMDATNFMEQHNRLWYDRYLYNNKLAPYGPTQYSSGFTPRFSQSDIASAGRGTDWLELVTRDGSIQQHNISISGGSNKVKTFTSINYYDHKGVVKNSDFTRYTGRFNIDYTSTSWLKIGTGISYTGTNARNTSTSGADGAETFNQILAAMQFPPNVQYDPENFDFALKSPYDPQLANPVSFLRHQDQSNSSRIFVTPNLELSLLPELKFKVQTGYDATSFERKFYLPREVKALLAPEGLANNRLNKNYNLSNEAFFTYDVKIGSSHTLNMVAGAGHYKAGSDGFGVDTYSFFTDAFGFNNIGVASNRERTGYYSFKYENTKLSQFARINYNINDKYLIALTARRDGSSTFAEGKKYGFFPGASIAWKMEEEEFLKNINAISQLKLRMGYGETGNERIVGNYPLTLYSTSYDFRFVQNGVTYNGVALTQVGNPNITWQTDIMANVGLDFGFLQDRFYGTVDLYRKTLKDLLQFDPLPVNAPIGSIANNIGSHRAQGMDFNLTSRVLTGKFKWTNDFNVSYVKVNWLERNPKQPLNPWQSEKDEVDAIFGWKTDGIITSANDIPSYMPNANVGNMKFVDISGPDGTPDGVLDRYDVVQLGNWNPRWNFGMNNRFDFMNFDLSVFIYGKSGNKRFDGYTGNNRWNNYYAWDRIAGAVGSRIYNSSPFVKDIWTHDNPNGIHPGVADNAYEGNNPAGNTDFYLLDNSFIRIKNIELGYQIPASVLQRTSFFKSIRAYVNVDNLSVITNWKGLDPENTEINPYPQVLSTSFGLNVNF
jgi:TonB-dependent starch-binding outer membrane protein SusC